MQTDNRIVLERYLLPGPSGSSKREGTPVGSSSGAPFTKKPKVASALSTISATRPAKTNDKSNVWETLAVEVDNCDFAAAVQVSIVLEKIKVVNRD